MLGVAPEDRVPFLCGLAVALPGVWLWASWFRDGPLFVMLAGLALVAAGGGILGFVTAEDRLPLFGRGGLSLVVASGMFWAVQTLPPGLPLGTRRIGWLLTGGLALLAATVTVAVPFVLAAGAGATVRERHGISLRKPT